jgi:uncharacterized membrane protein
MSTTPETSSPAAPAAAAPATEDRTVAILTYITIIGFIIAIVMHSSKKTALGSFHLRQGLGLFLTGCVIWIPCAIISLIPFVNFLMILVWPVVGLSLLALWIMGLIGAVNGQQKPLPVVGEYYQKWFAGAFV